MMHHEDYLLHTFPSDKMAYKSISYNPKSKYIFKGIMAKLKEMIYWDSLLS